MSSVVIVKYIYSFPAVRFMYDSCIESVNRLKTDVGSGCIIAHCMGLGKTLSVRILIVVACVSVLCQLLTNICQNWLTECGYMSVIETRHLVLMIKE